ncbi:hypothetical protein [Cryobacterium sp. TMT2-42-4]|uniref:hypothetical protein n=1 Tax=Cryobacterium sp. TMT2-42-4 TaxID=1259255 RepID=UPI00106BDAD3|nr:hypothetical protein [Cryobacterium sp. TMT2-42-4]TFC36231.1 hypothetical protein E3O18_08260 [Cryobacterium sp. TMT2-42-4]
MSSEDVLAGFSGLLVAYCGILVGTVFLPFVASFLLDGIVQILRGNGPKMLLGAFSISAVLAGIGYVLWHIGTENPSVTLVTLGSMSTVAQYLLTFSTALALLAFLSRTAKLLWKTRRAAA